MSDIAGVPLNEQKSPLSLSSTIQFIAQHPMNRGHRVQAVGRFFWWQVESRIRDEVEFAWIDGAKLVVRHGMTGATGNIYCGLHEYVDMAFVLHFLRDSDRFVDVGANVGSYSVIAAAVCGAETIAVEPDPDAQSALTRNIEVNDVGKLVEVAKVALGADRGMARFTVGRDTTNKVATESDGGTRLVPMTTLDRIVKGRQVTLMKMDVEGYESEVLKGAAGTLSDPALAAVITEGTTTAVRETLKEHGFREYFYDPGTRRLSGTSFGLSSCNGLYVRDAELVADRVASAPPRKIGRALL